MFGFPRLAQFLAAQQAAPDLIGLLLRQLGTFTGPGWEQEDDVMLVTLHRSAGYGRGEIAARSSIGRSAELQECVLPSRAPHLSPI